MAMRPGTKRAVVSAVFSLAVAAGLSSAADPCLEFARSEFAKYLPQTHIALRLKADPSLGVDAFRLRAVDGALEITGGNSRGCLFGVYSFLENEGGARFYTSWFELPPKGDVRLPTSLDRMEKPAFEGRCAYWFDAVKAPFCAKLRLNFNPFGDVPAEQGGNFCRFGKGLGSCHTLHELIPEDPRLCLTKEENYVRARDRVFARIASDPGARFYGISYPDCEEWCRCPECERVNGEEGSPAGTLVRFVNRLASDAEVRFPGVQLETLAYQHTIVPPKTKLAKNVIVCLCSNECDFHRPICEGFTAANRKFKKAVEGWGRNGPLYVWNYTTDFCGYLMPFPNTPGLVEDIRFFRDNKVKYLFEQGAYQGRHAEFAEWKAYLIAKAMWNPDLDEKALREDFFRGYYGAGAPHLLGYLEFLNATYAAFAKASGYELVFWQPDPYPCLDEAFRRRAREFWAAAEKATRGDAARNYHVRMGALTVDYLDLRAAMAARPVDKARLGSAAAVVRAKLEEAGDVSLLEYPRQLFGDLQAALVGGGVKETVASGGLGDAAWLWSEDESKYVRFKCRFEAGASPLKIRLPMDSRTTLYLDCRRIARGRGFDGDVRTCRGYELKLMKGKHMLEALVADVGKGGTVGGVPGFALKADGEYDAQLTTGKGSWFVKHFENVEALDDGRYRVTGHSPWGDFWGSGPRPVRTISDAGAVQVAATREAGPDAEGVSPGSSADAAIDALVRKGTEFTLEAGTERTVVWDVGTDDTRFVELLTSGGAGTEIRWSWSSDGTTYGSEDVYLSKGSAMFEDFELPEARKGRYLRMRIRVADKPITFKKLLLSSAGVLSRQTIVVNGPDDLESAVKKAAYGGKPGYSFDSCVELVLKPGVYEIGKQIAIPMSERQCIVFRGESDDPSKTVILGTNAGFSAYGSVGLNLVANLTFRGFHSPKAGAALYACEGHANYSVTNCVFEDCVSDADGGAAAVGRFRDCAFRRCRAARCGGALARCGWKPTSADGCTFEGCVAGERGGGAFSLAFASNCTFRACKAMGGFGGAAAGADCFVGGGSHKGHVPYVNCRFEGCFATFRFPAERRDVAVGGCARFENCTFVGSWMNDSGKSEGTSAWGRLTGMAYENRLTARPGDDLAAVRDRLRASRRPGAEATVALEDGVYEVKEALVLTERDAMTKWRARHPGKVTFVGGWNFRGRDMAPLADRSILGRLPTVARGKAVAISVPTAVRTNFVARSMLGGCPPFMGKYENYNGKGANRLGWGAHYPTYPVFSVDTHYMYPAQWPNGDEYMIAGEKEKLVLRHGSVQSNAVVRVTGGRSDGWRFEDADIYAIGFLRGCEYSTERASVPCRGAVTGTVEIAQKDMKDWARIRFVNVMEELDAPGEWCYDLRTGLLVLYPPEGFGADSVCALGTAADHFFHVLGSDIVLEGFNFTAKHSHPAVCVEGGERVSVRGCRFSGLEYWACFVSGRHNEVRSCDFTELPADGLFLCGGSGTDGVRGDNLIENCHAWKFGFMRNSWQRGGFHMTGCGNTMRHCQADTSQEVGFTYDGVDQLVEYCRTHTVSFWNGDSGAVYTQGGLSASYGCTFRYNDVSASPGYVNGLYCDDCCSGHTIYGNIVRNFGCGGIFIGGGRDNAIFNNIVIAPHGEGRFAAVGLHLDLRGLAWKQLRGPANASNAVAAVRAKWDPEASPVVKRHPQIARWFEDPMRIMAPFDDSWRDNVVIGCGRGGEVGTGSDKVSPDFRLVSERNLRIRVHGGRRPDAPWMLGGFKTIDGTTNAPLDVGFVDLPTTEKTFHGRQFTWRKGDLTLRPDSVVYRELPNFKAIPFAKIGLYRDSWRKDLAE